jgi:hypothetical protein
LEDAVVALQTQFPDHVFSQIGGIDALQDSGRLAWASARRTNHGGSPDWTLPS